MWSIKSGPEIEALPNGGDGLAFVWSVENDDGTQRTVRVEIARSALAAQDMPHPIPEVVKTKGAAAVSRFLDWRELPEVVTVSTVAVHPLPGMPDPGAS